MSDRQKILSRLIADRDYRAAYIRAKLDILIPSQLRALRLRLDKTQPELAQMADMKQPRISAMETPGLVNFNRETLVRMAATHNVGLVVKFVPFSEMLAWENSYSQDAFDPTRLPNDIRFLQPTVTSVRRRTRRKRTSASIVSTLRISQVPNAVRGGAASNTQMSLFESPAPLPAPAQEKIARVIALPNRERSIVDEPVFAKTAAAAAGAGRSYV